MTAPRPPAAPPPPHARLHRGDADGHEWLMDLLTARATEGVDASEAAEIERLLAEHPEVEPDGLDLAASALAVAYFDQDDSAEPMPAAVRRNLHVLAGRVTGESQPEDAASPAEPRRISSQAQVAGSIRPQRRLPGLGWLAAAAATAVAAIGWWRSIPPPTPSLRAQFVAFDRQVPDAVHWPWKSQEPGFESVQGEICWSDQLQKGFMTFRNLSPNDPTQRQYQLWVVDPSRDKHPVDGGVFDIASCPADANTTPSGEVIVPIVCKLPVASPAAFALTVEKPGGVVVSAGPLVLVAAK